MNSTAAQGDYGIVSEPATLTITRVLPGPIERVWAYLTDSDLRRLWLASGVMELKVGSNFELAWRNDELAANPGPRPAEFPEEHSMQAQITELDPPRRLGFTWGRSGGVTFDLEVQGRHVLLTVTHRRLPDADALLNVSAGWHAHLDILVARMAGVEPASFWPGWSRLKGDYAQRLAS